MLNTEQIEERIKNAASTRLAPSRGFIDAWRKEHGLGRENWAEARRRIRFGRKKAENAPRIVEMAQAHPLGIRVLENLGRGSTDAMLIRDDMGMGLEPEGKGRRLGQLAGAFTSDLTTDNSRGFWWLLNALQATGAVITEYAYGKARPDLFGVHSIRDKYGNELLRNEGTKNTAQRMGLIDQSGDTRRGVRLQKTGSEEAGKTHKYVQSNYAPTDVNSLLIPSGIAINTGLGLMAPFGGIEGYEATVPDPDDKTKTDNVLAEIAAKYILGRTGNLLPYEEFKKVRPDVSKGEYNAYKAFKYDKEIDYNPLDGDLSLLPAGALKYTNEGVHGPEIQFLGRGLPVTTGVIPFAAAVAGTTAGVTRGRPIRSGMIGGMAGLGLGLAGGNLLEAERRRRNQAQNESYGEL